MKISKDKLRKIIMQEIRISINQAVGLEEDGTPKFGDPSEEEEESGEMPADALNDPKLMASISEEESRANKKTKFKLTKGSLRALIQEEMDDWFYSNAEAIEQDDERDREKDRKAEEDYEREKKSKEKKKIEEDEDWIQGAEKDIEKRGTEGVCTGEKFGGPTCRPGTKRYNLAKTFRKMGKARKKKK